MKSGYPAGSLAELPCGLYVNVVQQDVQQQRRTTARVHDRGNHGLAAEIGESSHAPVVRIARVRPRWRFLAAIRRSTPSPSAPVSSISAGQQRNGQVADACDTGTDQMMSRRDALCRLGVAHRGEAVRRARQLNLI